MHRHALPCTCAACGSCPVVRKTRVGYVCYIDDHHHDHHHDGQTRGELVMKTQRNMDEVLTPSPFITHSFLEHRSVKLGAHFIPPTCVYRSEKLDRRNKPSMTMMQLGRRRRLGCGCESQYTQACLYGPAESTHVVVGDEAHVTCSLPFDSPSDSLRLPCICHVHVYTVVTFPSPWRIPRTRTRSLARSASSLFACWAAWGQGAFCPRPASFPSLASSRRPAVALRYLLPRTFPTHHVVTSQSMCTCVRVCSIPKINTSHHKNKAASQYRDFRYQTGTFPFDEPLTN